MANKKSPKKKKTTAKKKVTAKKTVAKKKKIEKKVEDEKVLNKKASPKKTTKKTSPKKATPKKASPKKVTPKKTVKKPVKKEEVKKEKVLVPIDEEKKEIKKDRSHKKAITDKAPLSPKKLSKKEKLEYLKTHDSTVESAAVRKLITILAAVGAFILTFYFVSSFLRGEFKKPEEETKLPSIQNEEILANNTFKKADGEYLVVFYDFDKIENEFLSSLINDYRSKNKLAIFKVDISKFINKEFIADESNLKEEDLKIKETTLLYIKDNKLVEAHESLKATQDYLKQLALENKSE